MSVTVTKSREDQLRKGYKDRKFSKAVYDFLSIANYAAMDGYIRFENQNAFYSFLEMHMIDRVKEHYQDGYFDRAVYEFLVEFYEGYLRSKSHTFESFLETYKVDSELNVQKAKKWWTCYFFPDIEFEEAKKWWTQYFGFY